MPIPSHIFLYTLPHTHFYTFDLPFHCTHEGAHTTVLACADALSDEKCAESCMVCAHGALTPIVTVASLMKPSTVLHLILLYQLGMYRSHALGTRCDVSGVVLM
jgi:hypothetical protein